MIRRSIPPAEGSDRVSLNLRSLPCPPQPFIKRLDHGVVSYPYYYCYVQQRSNGGSTFPNTSFPRFCPLSWFKEATPTNAEICLWLNCPTLGSPASRVLATTGSISGTLWSILFRCFSDSICPTNSSSVCLTCLILFYNHLALAWCGLECPGNCSSWHWSV